MVVLFGRGGLSGMIGRLSGMRRAMPLVKGQTRDEQALYLELQGLNKSFGALQATRDLSFCVNAGEIHAH